MKITLTATPMFPLEAFRQKRSRENSEKRLPDFLSKILDNIIYYIKLFLSSTSIYIKYK